MKTNKFFISAIALSVALTSFYACSNDDDDPTPLPPIGGFNSADEVGAADLVAYWPLNGAGTETKSSTNASSAAGESWVTGVKGQAVSLNSGYLKYPTIAGLSSGMESFTISTWFKVMNNGTSASVFLTLSRPNEWGGNVNFMAETGWMQPTSDSITVKGLIISDNALGWQDSRNAVTVSPDDAALGHVAHPNKVGGQWAHGVISWDGSSRMFKVYVDGVKISNPAWELRGADDSPAFAMASPTYPVIGAFATYANGTPIDVWDNGMTGQLDEMRVWKKVLSPADINSLYELELAGR